MCKQCKHYRKCNIKSVKDLCLYVEVLLQKDERINMVLIKLWTAGTHNVTCSGEDSFACHGGARDTEVPLCNLWNVGECDLMFFPPAYGSASTLRPPAALYEETSSSIFWGNVLVCCSVLRRSPNNSHGSRLLRRGYWWCLVLLVAWAFLHCLKLQKKKKSNQLCHFNLHYENKQ